MWMLAADAAEAAARRRPSASGWFPPSTSTSSPRPATPSSSCPARTATASTARRAGCRRCSWSAADGRGLAPRAQGPPGRVEIEPFGRVPSRVRAAAEAEAERLAAFLGGELELAYA